jgi:release factor glutamine methyltransferase
MPVVLSPGRLADMIATLRAAGCVFADEEAELLASAASSQDELDGMVGRRVSGLPIEQVVGWAEFCGLRIAVTPGVFVPRRRSEFLVQEAAGLGIAARRASNARPVVVDMCCGSGAIGIALAAALGQAELHAVDIDPVAVACACGNLPIDGHAYQGDLYEPLPSQLRGRVSVLVANAPYVPTSELRLMPAEARLHEPAVALDGGIDGVRIQQRVAAGAPEWLAPDGHLLIETSERQAPLTAQAVTDAGLVAHTVTNENWATAVVIGGRSGEPQGAPPA